MTGIVKELLAGVLDILVDVFLLVLNNSSLVIWLILAVLALRFVVRKPKFIHCILWGLVGLRLIMPFSLESSFSLVPSSGELSKASIGEEMKDMDVNSMNLPEINNQIQVGAALEAEQESESVSDSVSTHSVVAQSKRLELASWILECASAIWFTGIVIMLTYSAISYYLLKRKVKFAVLYQDNIWQSEAVSTPFVLGFFKPGIYIPFHLQEGDIEYVLSHEKAHIKRKDHWIKLLGFLVLSVYWFHPLVWLSYIFLCKDIEHACDEYVLKQMGQEHKTNYASALLHCSTSGKRLGFCQVSFGETSVKQRVKSVLNYKKPGFWLIFMAVVGIIVLAVCFMTSPKKNGENAGSVAGVYVGGECLYMNPLSSVFPYDENYSESTVGGADGPENVVVGGAEGLENVTTDAEEFSRLQKALDNAILEYGICESKSKNADTFFDCEILDWERGERMEGSQRISTVSIYAQVLHYHVEEDKLFTEYGTIQSSGGHCSAKIDLEYKDGEYICVDYWTPRDGSYLKKDIDEVFGAVSKELAENALDSQKYILKQTQAIYMRIVGKYDLDTDKIIEENLSKIMESPKGSSNPADYVSEHSIEYRELTYYGEYTLSYAKEQLAKGENGLKEAILEMLVEDLEK